MSTRFDDTKWYSYTSSTQTMKTWTRHLKSFEEVPEEFQPAFPEYKDHFPYTLFIPEDRRTFFVKKRNKKIICLYDDHFVFLEIPHNEVKTSTHNFTDVLYLERGKILLYSWLRIITLSGTLYIRFNTTNDYLFRPVIEKIRQGMSHAPRGVASSEVEKDKRELSKFDYLIRVNYKYMNYGKDSIRPGDPVIGIVYQPERCVQEFKLFNKTLFKRYAIKNISSAATVIGSFLGSEGVVALGALAGLVVTFGCLAALGEEKLALHDRLVTTAVYRSAR